eukprot:TRINITY_DN3553_c0_g1_i2.p1 TRINITY_DN3553_c0_g1~~TRINITY_DN3553_c0_g1_i2.p1  ORF type:complete len:419 (+),score=124.30 TRINITY_DN3553_c0_g1_i2:232-1488(+)
MCIDIHDCRSLSDFDKDGHLNEKEYLIAKFLIYAKSSQQELPDRLPATLVRSVGLQDPTTSTPQNHSTPPQPEDRMTLTPQDYKNYKDTFVQVATNGLVTGAAAIALFSKSNLSQDVLAKVWEMSDLDKDNSLSESEFAIAMHLIAFAIASGGQLPLQQAPPNLVNSAKARSTATSTPNTNILMSNPGMAAPVVAPPQPIIVPEINLPDITISIPVPPVPQIDANIVVPPISDLADKYGIAAEPIILYDPSNDIKRLDTEVTNSKTAQAVLEQSEPELKQLAIKIEKETILSQSLSDKAKFTADQLNVVENQRQQLINIMKDYHNQAVSDEQELQNIYNELTAMKQSILELATSSGATPDPNQIRLQRQQIDREQAEVTLQLEQISLEKVRIATELEALKLDIQQSQSSLDSLQNVLI